MPSRFTQLLLKPLFGISWQSHLKFGCRCVRPNLGILGQYFVGKKLCICDLLTPDFVDMLYQFSFGDVSWKRLAVRLQLACWLYVLRVLFGFKVKAGTGFACYLEPYSNLSAIHQCIIASSHLDTVIIQTVRILQAARQCVRRLSVREGAIQPTFE